MHTHHFQSRGVGTFVLGKPGSSSVQSGDLQTLKLLWLANQRQIFFNRDIQYYINLLRNLISWMTLNNRQICLRKLVPWFRNRALKAQPILNHKHVFVLCTMCNYVVSIRTIVLDIINQFQSKLPPALFFSWTSQLHLELGGISETNQVRIRKAKPRRIGEPTKWYCNKHHGQPYKQHSHRRQRAQISYPISNLNHRGERCRVMIAYWDANGSLSLKCWIILRLVSAEFNQLTACETTVSRSKYTTLYSIYVFPSD